MGQIELDPYPTMHVRDLVAHEAHRHPYIEILGTMYLMKLRYSKSFGSRAGSAWRLMFVYALLPWMYQYRIHDYDGGEDIDLDAVVEKADADSEDTPPVALAFDSALTTIPDGSKVDLSSAEPLSLKAFINLEEENMKLRNKLKKLSVELREMQHDPKPPTTPHDDPSTGCTCS